ncbi:MAG: prepilin peptidase [Deltaproteobacteria bacterium]|nr:MAG: prepilin peptidase [Deltaproteobacteria bacterium]
MVIVQTIFFLLLLTTAITDLAYKKIYNFITIPAMVLGLLGNACFGGWDGLQLSLIGLLVGGGVFFLIFIFGGIGGGDVKLMAAIGALMGYPFIVGAVFYSVLVGGLMAIILMIWRNALWSSVKNISLSLYTAFVPGLERVPLNPENSLPVPYGMAIVLGTLGAWIERYLL